MRSASAVGIAVAIALAGCDDSSHLRREFRIPSPAMVPTIDVGDHVKADIEIYRHERPKRGDIVVFRPPLGADNDECGMPEEPEGVIRGRACELPTPETSENTFIKRVVALPDEWLKIVGNRAYVASSPAGPFKRVDQPSIATRPCGELCNFRTPIVMPPDHYFVLGDNRGASDDSRQWGPIPWGSLIGKVVEIDHR